MTIHNQAPAVTEGCSPFRTPGTVLQWHSLAEWLRAAATLEQRHDRHISSKTYRDLAAHIDELARHPDFIAAQPLDELEPTLIWFGNHRPPHGHRAGTSYERIVNGVSNAIARERKWRVHVAHAE